MKQRNGTAAGVKALALCLALASAPAGAIGVDASIIVAKMAEEIQVILQMYQQMKQSYDALQEMKRLSEDKGLSAVIENQIARQVGDSLGTHTQEANQTRRQEDFRAASRRLKEIDHTLQHQQLTPTQRKILHNEYRLLLVQQESAAQIDQTSSVQVGEKEALNQLVRNTAQLIELQSNQQLEQRQKEQTEGESGYDDFTSFFTALQQARPSN